MSESDIESPQPEQRRRRRWPLLAVLGLALLLVIAVGFTAVQGLRAGISLASAQRHLTAAKTAALAGDAATSQRELRQAQSETGSAHRETSNPLWSLATHLPWLGASVDGARVVAAQADLLTQRVLPPLVASADGLQPSKLRIAGARFDLTPIARVAPQLATAASQVDGVRKSLDALPVEQMLGPIAGPVRKFQQQVADLQDTLHGLDTAAALAPAMLGNDGPRRYLVAFQNPAESRGTGGLLGAYAVLQADHGHLSLIEQGSDAELRNVDRMPIDLGPDFQALYNDDPAWWINSNESPHFPYAARIWLALWQQTRGKHLDGVVTVDPVVLSRILRVTGPVRLPDGERITGDNVVDKTLSEAYQRFDKPGLNDERKAYLLQVSEAAISGLFSGKGSTRQLLDALGTSVADRRLMVYSTRAREESRLVSAGLAGELQQTSQPYALVTVVNAKGSKLDYYLDRNITYAAEPCRRSDGLRATTVTARLHSDVAASERLPDYVDGVPPPGTPALKRNNNKLLMTLYATRGAQLANLVVNGKPANFAEATEQGHPAYQVTVEVPAGKTVTVQWSLEEPIVDGAPLVPVQPLVREAKVAVDWLACT